MTAKITIERISSDEIRVMLVADIRITGNLIELGSREVAKTAAGAASGGAADGVGPGNF
jgi:hypothetical protein